MDGELTKTAREIAFILASYYRDSDMLPFVDENNDEAELLVDGERLVDDARVTLRWKKID